MKTQNKPVIEDVIISKEEMDELNSKLELSVINKGRIISRHLGGSCTYCAGIPTKRRLMMWAMTLKKSNGIVKSVLKDGAYVVSK